MNILVHNVNKKQYLTKEMEMNIIVQYVMSQRIFVML
jgi:hypothetical protein